MKATAKQVKEVTIVARYQFKADPRKVCYLVRSSNGKDTYMTCLFDGKATSCQCASRKPCYHMTQLELREQSRGSEEHKAEHAGLVEAPNGNLLTPEELANVPGAKLELEDEEQRLQRWTALELATLRKGPVPAGKAPTPRKVSEAWLLGCRR